VSTSQITLQHTGELSIEPGSVDVTLYDPQTPENDSVVFDLGGVLLDWDPRYLYRRLIDDEAEMERFLGEICTLEWHAAHDRGVPMAESCAALAAAHPEYAELINAWSERSEEMIAGPIRGSVEILDGLLQKGVRCYALTNMERETYPLRLQRFPFMGWFAGTVVSSHEGVAKPDPEIFLRLLDRFGLVPERTIMIDDSPPNIDTAVSLGMKAVRFTSPTALRAALDGLRLTSYPSDRERY
jgi:2-haloacid dehalogenase